VYVVAFEQFLSVWCGVGCYVVADVAVVPESCERVAVVVAVVHGCVVERGEQFGDGDGSE